MTTMYRENLEAKIFSFFCGGRFDKPATNLRHGYTVSVTLDQSACRAGRARSAALELKDGQETDDVNHGCLTDLVGIVPCARSSVR